MFLRTLAIAVLAAVCAGNASGSGSATVTLNATVVPVCKFFTGAPVLNVRTTGTSGSSINPSLTTTATGSVGITYRCTRGVSPSFTVPATATVTCAACPGAPTMATTISATNNGAGRGFQPGGGRNRTLTVTGQISPAVFQNARAGAYSGTMTISVTP